MALGCSKIWSNRQCSSSIPCLPQLARDGREDTRRGQLSGKKGWQAAGRIDACQGSGKNSTACRLLWHSLWQHYKDLQDTNSIVAQIINRPSLAGAVLQTLPLLIDWFIHSLIHPFWKYLQTIITSKRLELWTWNFDTMFTIPYVSRVTCKKNYFKKMDKVVELVGRGSVINGAYPV